jgi:ABC-type multidrug transport system permease subunit
MIDYEWTATKFFQNMFFMFITILYHIYYGMMVIGVCPNNQVSSIVSSIFYSTWNLFTGFVIPRTVTFHLIIPIIMHLALAMREIDQVSL